MMTHRDEIPRSGRSRTGPTASARLLIAAVVMLLGSGATLLAQGSSAAGAVIDPFVIGSTGVQQEGDYGAFFATVGEPLNVDTDTTGVIDQSTWIGFIVTVGSDPTSGVRERQRDVRSGATGIASMLPNPFTGSTRLLVRLEHPGSIRLSVFDQLGREIARLIDGDRSAGEITVDWTPSDRLSSGTYLLELEIDGVRYPAQLIQYYR